MPNYADATILLGDSHNVFVGRVVSKVGARPAGSIDTPPSSQFAVRVLVNIKGNLKGIVTVNQFETSSFKPLLQIGATYIIAARYNKNENWYVATIYPWNYQLLTEDETLSDDQLTALADNNDKFKALQAAYPNERVSLYDIKSKKNYNSYASRHYDANGELIDDNVELAKQRASASPSLEPAATEIPVGS